MTISGGRQLYFPDMMGQKRSTLDLSPPRNLSRNVDSNNLCYGMSSPMVSYSAGFGYVHQLSMSVALEALSLGLTLFVDLKY